MRLILYAEDRAMQNSKDLASVIFETLKTEILNLSLKPGEELTEVKLCERFGASRTPVRTVLQRLLDIDLVESEPYQYTRVSKIDYSVTCQMIFLRSIVEGRIISDFMENATAFDIEDLEHIIRKEHILLSGNFNPTDFYSLDAAFHSFFYEKMEAMYIWNLINESVHYTRFRMLDIVKVGDFEAIIKEHEEMLSMIKSKDVKDIPSLIEYHFNGGLRRIENRSDDFYRDNLINYRKK